MDTLEIVFSVISLVLSFVSIFFSGKVYINYRKNQVRNKNKINGSNNLVLNFNFQQKIEGAMKDNIGGILTLAENDSEISEKVLKTLDNQWLLQFYSFARNSSDEEIRKIWARLLNKELESKGSVPKSIMRTISFMDSEDAECFNRIAKHVFDGVCIFSRFVDSSDVLILQEANLVSPPTLFSEVKMVNPHTKLVVCKNSHLSLVVTNKGDKKEEIQITIFSLTRAGIKLYEVLGFTPADDCIYNVCDYLKEEYGGNKKLEFDILDSEKVEMK